MFFEIEIKNDPFLSEGIKMIFKDVAPGGKFYVNDDNCLVEHLKLVEPHDDWNCVDIKNACLGHICDTVAVVAAPLPPRFR